MVVKEAKPTYRVNIFWKNLRPGLGFNSDLTVQDVPRASLLIWGSMLESFVVHFAF